MSKFAINFHTDLPLRIGETFRAKVNVTQGNPPDRPYISIGDVGLCIATFYGVVGTDYKFLFNAEGNKPAILSLNEDNYYEILDPIYQGYYRKLAGYKFENNAKALADFRKGVFKPVWGNHRCAQHLKIKTKI